MEKLKRFLASHSVLALDTAVFIYHFEAHPVYSRITESLLHQIALGNNEAVISELVLLELLVKPLSLDRQDLADQYETLLGHFPHLRICPIDRAVLRRAAQLRSHTKANTPDAIHVATAIEGGATLFICNDRGLKKISGIEILILDSLLKSS